MLRKKLFCDWKSSLTILRRSARSSRGVAGSTVVNQSRNQMRLSRLSLPAGHATVEVTATSHSGAGKYPTMVIAIGGHSSPPMLVDHQGIYTTELDLTGAEEVFTIRFLYEDNADPGEFKLYVEGAKISVKLKEE